MDIYILVERILERMKVYIGKPLDQDKVFL